MDIPPPRPVFDPAAARVERQLKLGSPAVGCRFDPSGRFLFASAQDDNVHRFELETGKQTTLAGHKSWVRGLAFVRGKGEAFTLVSADYHGRLIWWPGDADSPKPQRTVPAHDGFARAVAVSPDQTVIASCGNDNLVKLWGAADGKPLQTLEGHESHVYNVAFHPGGSRLVSCDLKGVVKEWDPKTGKCERELDAKVLHKYDPTFRADIGGARGLNFNKDGSALALCGITNVSNAFAGVGNPAVVLIDWDSGKPKLLKTKVAFQGTAWGVAFHPSGAVVAAGGAGQGRVWFFVGGDMENAHTVNVPANARDLALSPGGDRLAVAGANGIDYVYDFAGPAAPATPPKKK